jgi:hypothetical protein
MVNFPFLIPDAFLKEPWTRQLLETKREFEPYLYSLAHAANRTGDPITSPLIHYFQEDERARDATAETMLGTHVLIGGGNLHRTNSQRADVYVPKGRWYDYFNKRLIINEEGALLEIDTKSEGYYVTPILFKAGAIVPTWDKNENYQGVLAVKMFPGEEPSRFFLYEDDGNTAILQDTMVRITRLELYPRNAKGEVIFVIKARQGSPLASEESRSFRLEFYGVGNVKYAILDEQPDNRVDSPEKLAKLKSGYFARRISSSGSSRGESDGDAPETGPDELIFKTPPLDLSKDHALVISLE